MDYQPGDEILILTDNPTTLQDCRIGPFPITQIHTNGTITIQHTPHIVEYIYLCGKSHHIDTDSAHSGEECCVLQP